ncbi:hypothetical protein OROMI_033435 [Orobanche minor]
MSGKGAKGLLTGKTPASKDKDKDNKKKPTSRSFRAGLQVIGGSGMDLRSKAMVIQHDQGLAEEADNSMQEADQDYLNFGRSHGRIHKVLIA